MDLSTLKTTRLGVDVLSKEVFNGATADGAHAHYMKCPARTLVPLPNSLSFETGAAISVAPEQLGAPYSGFTLKASIRSPFGRAQWAFPRRNWRRASKRELVALDINEERLQRQDARADVFVNVNATANVVEAIRDVTTHGLGADLALDASGAASARRIAKKFLIEQPLKFSATHSLA